MLHRLLAAMRPIFLKKAGGDFVNDLAAEKRHEVIANPLLMPFDVAGIALAFGDDGVFAQELLGGELERFAGLDLVVFHLAAQSQISGEVESFVQRLAFGSVAKIFFR